MNELVGKQHFGVLMRAHFNEVTCLSGQIVASRCSLRVYGHVDGPCSDIDKGMVS